MKAIIVGCGKLGSGLSQALIQKGHVVYYCFGQWYRSECFGICRNSRSRCLSYSYRR